MSVFKHVATGDGDIDVEIEPSNAFALESVSLHLSDTGDANDLTVSIDAVAGAAYDKVVLKQDMTTVEDLFWQPDRPIELSKGDKILVAWTNGSSRTYGLTVVWSGR